MSWEVYMLKTATNQEKDLSEIEAVEPMPSWRELKAMLHARFPDLASGRAVLDEGISFPFLSSPDYAWSSTWRWTARMSP